MRAVSVWYPCEGLYICSACVRTTRMYTHVYVCILANLFICLRFCTCIDVCIQMHRYVYGCRRKEVFRLPFFSCAAARVWEIVSFVDFDHVLDVAETIETLEVEFSSIYGYRWIAFFFASRVNDFRAKSSPFECERFNFWVLRSVRERIEMECLFLWRYKEIVKMKFMGNYLIRLRGFFYASGVNKNLIFIFISIIKLCRL